MTSHTFVEVEDYRGYKIEVHYDFDAEKPNDFCDMLSTFVHWHRRYHWDVDGRDKYETTFNFFEDLAGVSIDDLQQFERINEHGWTVCEDRWKYRGRWYDLDSIRDKIVELAYKNAILIPVGMYDHSGYTFYEGTGPHAIDSAGWDSGQVGFLYVTKNRLRSETGYNEQELFSTDRNRKPRKGDHVKAAKQAPKDRSGKHDWGKVIRVKRNGSLVVDFNNGYIPAVRRPEHTLELHPDDITEVMADRGQKMLRAELNMWDEWATGQIYGYKIFEIDENGEEDREIASRWGFYGDYNDYMLPECRSIIDSYIKADLKAHLQTLKNWIRNRVPFYARQSF